MSIEGYGTISVNKDQLTVCGDRHVSFYEIDIMNLKVKLNYTMFNFLNCSKMILNQQGIRQFCISFQAHSNSFEIYSQKYLHNVKIRLNSENMSSCIGYNLPSKRYFIVVEPLGTVYFYDKFTFKPC